VDWFCISLRFLCLFAAIPKARGLALGYKYFAASDFAPISPLAVSDKTRLSRAALFSTLEPIRVNLRSSAVRLLFASIRVHSWWVFASIRGL